MRLVARAGLAELGGSVVGVPTDKGSNAGVEVASQVAGMVAGAESFDDLAVLRSRWDGQAVLSDLRTVDPGLVLAGVPVRHVRQFDAVASRFLHNLTEHTDLLGGKRRLTAGPGDAFLDVADTVVQVWPHQARCRVRLQPGPRPERAARDRDGVRGRRRWLWRRRSARVPAPQPAAGDGWPPTRQGLPPAACCWTTGAGPDGIGVLRPQPDPGRARRRDAGIGHAPGWTSG
jgi:hypothetical protein